MNILIVILLIILFFLFNRSPKTKNNTVSTIKYNESFIDTKISYDIIYLTKPLNQSIEYYLVTFYQLSFEMQKKIINSIKNKNISIDENLNNLDDLLDVANKNKLFIPRNDIIFAVEKPVVNLDNIIQNKSIIVLDSNNQGRYLNDFKNMNNILDTKQNICHDNNILFLSNKLSNIVTFNNNKAYSNFNDNSISKFIELTPILYTNNTTKETETLPIYLVSLTNNDSKSVTINKNSLFTTNII